MGGVLQRRGAVRGPAGGRRTPGHVETQRRALRWGQKPEWRDWRGASGGREDGPCPAATLGEGCRHRGFLRSGSRKCPSVADVQPDAASRTCRSSQPGLCSALAAVSQVDKVGAQRGQPGLGRKGTRSQLPGCGSCGAKGPARCCLQGQHQWAHPRRGWLPEQGEQEPGKRAGQAQFLVGTLPFQPWLEPRFQPGVSLPERSGPVTLGSADIGGLLPHTCCLPGCERVFSCGQEQGLLHLQIPGSNPVALSAGPGWGKLLAPGS